MALVVITGPANVGKSGLVREHLSRALRAGGYSLLLLPAAPDVTRALQEIAADEPVGVAVKTFDAYLDGLWYALGDGRSIVSSPQRRLILSEIVRERILPKNGTTRNPGGYVGVLSRLAGRAAEGEWETLGGARAGVTAARADAAAPETDASRREVLGDDFVGCIAAYRERLARAGLVERSEAHRRAVAALQPGMLPSSVAIHRFTGFTTAQEAYLARVAPLTDVLVSLTYSPDIPATFGAAGTVAGLSALGTVREIEARTDYSASAELVRIERCLGESGDGTVAAEGAVVLSEAWGEGAESARIVREVQDALALGVRAERIAVVFREPGARMRSLGAAFDEAGIGHDWDVQIPFGRIPLGRAVLGVLGLTAPEPDESTVIDLLRSPYSPAGRGAMDALDARMRRHGASGWPRLQAWCLEADAAAGRFLREAHRAAAMIGKEQARSQWHGLLMRMLGRARAAGVGSDADMLADAGVVRVVMETLEGMRVLGGQAVAAADLAAVLRETAVTLASPERAGHVQVMSAERIRGRRFECVIAGGLVAGEFPRRVREDVLSAPGMREVFAMAGIDVSERGGTDVERLLFYQVVTRASRRLVLSWQSHDHDGKPLRPSILLEELLDLYRDPATGEYFAGKPPHHTLGLDGLALHSTGPNTPRRGWRAIAAGEDADPALVDGDAEWRVAEAARRIAPGTRGLGGAVKEQLASREVFSASEIETYLQCPFRWYAERVIRPRELDVRLDAAAAGRTAHEIMRRFYVEFRERAGEERVTPESLGLARDVHREIAHAVLAECRSGSVVEEAGMRAAALGTARLIEADATLLPGMAPRYLEWSFGMDEGDAPEVFGDFALAGRIDRIDANQSHLVVSDYKLGAVTSARGMQAFDAEGLVQLPLYALVASRRLGLGVAGGLYRSVKGGRPRGFVGTALAGEGFVRTDRADAAGIEELLAGAVARAAEAVRCIRRGAIDPQPRRGACPAYCGARQFCTEWRPGRG